MLWVLRDRWDRRRWGLRKIICDVEEKRFWRKCRCYKFVNEKGTVLVFAFLLKDVKDF
jgi:hypothetical protein